MAKKKRLLLCIILLVFMHISAFIVVAHPGRTDTNSGHTDHGTGEYHYHHGYPAHDHYDMDDDGVLDCPYNFDDKTNHESGGSNVLENTTTAPSEPIGVENDAVSKRVTVGDVLKAMLIWLLPSVALGLVTSYFLFYIFSIFLGSDVGCSLIWFSFILISIVSYIWLLYSSLRK